MYIYINKRGLESFLGFPSYDWLKEEADVLKTRSPFLGGTSNTYSRKYSWLLINWYSADLRHHYQYKLWLIKWLESMFRSIRYGFESSLNHYKFVKFYSTVKKLGRKKEKIQYLMNSIKITAYSLWIFGIRTVYIWWKISSTNFIP